MYDNKNNIILYYRKIMTDKEKLVLRKNYAFLVKKLDAPSIRVSLNAEGLLTDYELAEVQAQSVAPAANELILAALKRRAPGFLEKFCRVLEEEPANQQIVDKLREGRQHSYLLIHPTITLTDPLEYMASEILFTLPSTAHSCYRGAHTYRGYIIYAQTLVDHYLAQPIDIIPYI